MLKTILVEAEGAVVGIYLIIDPLSFKGSIHQKLSTSLTQIARVLSSKLVYFT